MASSSDAALPMHGANPQPHGTRAAASTAHAVTSPADPVLRQTAWGWIRGVDDSARSGTWQWKGVPYARPPVGGLRWRAPQPPAAWSGVRACERFAPAACQLGRLYGPGANNGFDASIGATLGQPLGDEDCLYLNIWQPASAMDSPRPVLVWVHGGSNVSGYTADPVFDGGAMARTQGLVVVSVAYRLGVFGFLDLPALKTGDPLDDSGNFALLDIALALQFVQTSIAAFGGDPGCVSLMGHSAGAVNACALMSSPWIDSLPQPPFHRLVSLSGGISTAASLPPGAVAPVPPRAVTQARAEALLAASLEASGQASSRLQGAALAQHLRAQPAAALLALVRDRLASRGLAAAQVIADGWVVARDPVAAIRAGHCRAVPLLAGTTRDEARLFPALLARPDLGGQSGRLLDDAQVFAAVQAEASRESRPARVEDWIPAAMLPVDAPVRGFHARCEQLDRLWFQALRDDLLDAMASRQSAVWHYRFDWRLMPAPFDDLFGAAHGFDLPFVWGNFGPSLHARIGWTEDSAAARQALSRALMDAVGAFARSGDPQHAGLPCAWPRWPGTLVFDATRTALSLAPVPATGARTSA